MDSNLNKVKKYKQLFSLKPLYAQTEWKVIKSEVNTRHRVLFSKAPLLTSRAALSLTFINRFVFFQGFDFLSYLAELFLYFKKERFDLLVWSCVKIVGSIHIVTFGLGVGNSRVVIIVCFLLRGGSAQCARGKKEEQIHQAQDNTRASHSYQFLS